MPPSLIVRQWSRRFNSYVTDDVNVKKWQTIGGIVALLTCLGAAVAGVQDILPYRDSADGASRSEGGPSDTPSSPMDTGQTPQGDRTHTPSAVPPSSPVSLPPTTSPPTQPPPRDPPNPVPAVGLVVTFSSPSTGATVPMCSEISGTFRNLDARKVLWIIIRTDVSGVDKFYVGRPIDRVDARTGRWRHSLRLATENDVGNGPYLIQVQVADKELSETHPTDVEEAWEEVDGFTLVREVEVTRGRNNC